MRAVVYLLIGPLFVCGQAAAPSVSAVLERGRQLESRDDFAAAEKLYTQALSETPKEPELLKRLGLVYQTELKFPESIEILQKLLADNPTYPEANFYLGMSWFGLNEFDKALAGFEKELQIDPKYRRARYYGAMALQSLGRRAEGLLQLEILSQQDPNDIRVWYQLARLHRAEAFRALRRVADIGWDSAEVHALKAESYIENEKYPEAAAEYEQVLKKQPNFPSAHFGLGEIYYRNHDTRAEEELRLALREDPGHPVANYYLGEMLLKAQRPKDALPFLQSSIAADPTMAIAQYQLGKCYLDLGDEEKGLQALLKAAELNPSSRETHYKLAQVYAKRKDEQNRKRHLEIFERLADQENAKSQSGNQPAPK